MSRGPALCPACGEGPIAPFGIGTQRVVDDLAKLYPAARIVRMDADSTTRIGDHARLLELLVARLGPENVLRPAPVADHRPEVAARWVVLAGSYSRYMPAGWISRGSVVRRLTLRLARIEFLV